MDELVQDFLKSLQADGKSKCTITAYRTDLISFSDFFKDKKVETLRYADLRRWVNYMEEQGFVATTRARKIASVKSFFRYLVKMEVITANPADVLDTPKIEKKQPVVISNDEASDLLYHAKNDGGSEVVWFRDYAVVSVFLFTGIRREELTNIKLQDVDLQKKSILIHGKGNKQRTVYISDVLLAVLSEYIKIYRCKIHRASGSEYLFPSIKSDKMALCTVNRIVNKIFESAGLKKDGVSAHILRKRFATSVFDKTHDIATVSKLLGHSSPTVTLRYIAINEDDLRSATETVEF